MPFDTAEQSAFSSATLSTIGLSHIGIERITRWKGIVERRYSRRSLVKKERLSEGSAGWSSTRLLPIDRFPQLYPTAPKDVKALVARIANIPDADDFSIEYFDTDPILYVYIRSSRRCVAIWDRGVIRAICHGATLGRTQQALRCLVSTV